MRYLEPEKKSVEEKDETYSTSELDGYGFSKIEEKKKAEAWIFVSSTKISDGIYRLKWRRTTYR